MSSHANPVPGRRERVRRRLLVDYPFQLRALRPLLVFVLLYVLLLAAFLFVPLQRSVAAEPDIGVRAILQAQLFRLHLYLWPLLVTSALIAAYYSLHWSLRVVGPLYRLHRTLNELVEGEARPLQLRPKDEFRYFEEDVAALGQKMRLIATRNRDILLAVHAHVKRLHDRLAADEIIARADLDEAVKAMLAQLEKAPEISLTTRR